MSDVVVHPVLQILPLVAIFGLLIGYRNRRYHPLVAGLAGALVAVLVGGGQLSLSDINSQFLKGVNGIMFSSVMVFAATALFLSKVGAVRAFVDLIRKVFGKYGSVVVGLLVFTQAVVVYMAGHGAANTLVIGPLIYSLVGWIPEVVAALSIVSPASWTTSPASAETATTAKIAGISPEQYVQFMRPYTFLLWIVAVALAMYGARRRGVSFDKLPPELENTPTSEIFKKAFPFIVFLILVILEPMVNHLLGRELLAPIVVLFLTVLITVVVHRPSLNDAAQWWAEAPKPLLGYLFYAGVFLGFINVISLLGTFDTIAGVVHHVPTSIVIVTAIVVGFFTGIVAGAYTAMVMALIHPILVAAGIPWQALGFINYGIGLGAMMSPVQVNVSATAVAFQKEIMDVIKNNVRFHPFILLLPIILALLVL